MLSPSHLPRFGRESSIVVVPIVVSCFFPSTLPTVPNKRSDSADSKTDQQKPLQHDAVFQNEKATYSRAFQPLIYARLDSPYVSLFRLGIRIFELCFALGSGISYAIDVSHGRTASAFIYSQVVFDLAALSLLSTPGLYAHIESRSPLNGRFASFGSRCLVSIMLHIWMTMRESVPIFKVWMLGVCGEQCGWGVQCSQQRRAVQG